MNFIEQSFDSGSDPEFVIGVFSFAPQRMEEQGTGLYILEIDNRSLNMRGDVNSAHHSYILCI